MTFIDPASETSNPTLAELVLDNLTEADQDAMIARLAGLLPPSWFGTGATEIENIPGSPATPVLNTVLSGPAYNLAWIYVLYVYTLTQGRIATATGVWLDRISYDFCGTLLPRLANEQDNSYRIRIIAEILRPRQTREGIKDIMLTLTGAAPKIIELWNTGDTFAYGINGQMGYGVSGIYGSLQYNNQVFITAFRPLASEGIANVAGYGTPYSGYGAGNGSGAYVSLSWIQGAVTDSAIYAAIAGIIAAGITAWVAIEDQTAPTGPAEMYFGDIENTQDLAIQFFYY